MTYVVNRRRRALGAIDLASFVPPPIGTPQSPISPLIPGGHGGYLEVRNSPADGSCGVGAYPCKHPGLDVLGMYGTTVVAPEDGTIAVVTDGNSAPFGGYGPWVVVIAGKSGKFHLLGHLDPANGGTVVQGQDIRAGEPVGTTSGANHTHWEVRSKVVPDYAHGETGFDIIEDPQIWLKLSAVGLGGMSPQTLLIVAGGAFLLALAYRDRRR